MQWYAAVYHFFDAVEQGQVVVIINICQAKHRLSNGSKAARVVLVSASEIVDPKSEYGSFLSEDLKDGIYSFPAWLSATRNDVKTKPGSLTCCAAGSKKLSPS